MKTRWVLVRDIRFRFGNGERTLGQEGLVHEGTGEAIRATIMIGTALTGGTRKQCWLPRGK